MATRKTSTNDEATVVDSPADEAPVETTDENTSVDTSETVPAGTQTTSDNDLNDVPTDAEKRDDEPVEATLEALDESEAGSFDDGVEGALGTVQENGYDVPWTYLTADHLGGDKVRTSDSDDEGVVKWNVQQAFETEDKDDVVALVAVQATPGQTFLPEELPNIDSLVKAGIDPVQFLSGLPVRQNLGEDEVPRRGIPA